MTQKPEKNQESGSSQSQIRKVRIQKMENLRERGLNPYPYGYDKDIMAQDLQEKYKELPMEKKRKISTTLQDVLWQTVTQECSLIW